MNISSIIFAGDTALCFIVVDGYKKNTNKRLKIKIMTRNYRYYSDTSSFVCYSNDTENEHNEASTFVKCVCVCTLFDRDSAVFTLQAQRTHHSCLGISMFERTVLFEV